MRLLQLLLCIGLYTVINAQVQDRSVDGTILPFEHFKLRYNKTYPNKVEEIFRRNIYNARVEEFQEHNKRYQVGLVSWAMGVNYFTDLTKEETRQRMKFNVSIPQDREIVSFPPNPNFKPLREFDWRKKGAVTPVKRQGLCGMCAIFAAVASTETQYFRMTGQLKSLSEQYILDCEKPNGCAGGNQVEALEFIADKGIVADEDYRPFADEQMTCRPDLELKQKEHFRIGGFMKIENEKDILDAVQTMGPVVVGISSEPLTHGYSKGVLSDKSQCMSMNHAVTIVGFGTEDGKDYYVVKNSWGPTFGEDGYFRVERNINYCGIADFAIVPFAVKD